MKLSDIEMQAESPSSRSIFTSAKFIRERNRKHDLHRVAVFNVMGCGLIVCPCRHACQLKEGNLHCNFI